MSHGCLYMNHRGAPGEWRCSRGPRDLPILRLLTNTPWIVVVSWASDATGLYCFWNVNGFFTYCFPCYAFLISYSSSNVISFNLQRLLTFFFDFRCSTALIPGLNANLRTMLMTRPHFRYENIQSCKIIFDLWPNLIPHTEWHHHLIKYLSLDNFDASYIAKYVAKV